MVNRLQLFFEHVFSHGDVVERDGAVFEESFLHLAVHDLIHQSADTLFRVLVQASGSGFHRVRHHQNGLFQRERVRTGVSEKGFVYRLVRILVLV